MPEWKERVKALAEDFCISQVKVNKLLKQVECKYEQREREIPKFYKGNEEDYLYDTALREMRSLMCA